MMTPSPEPVHLVVRPAATPPLHWTRRVKGKRFKDGVGTFYSDDTLRGKPIKVRFTWSDITASRSPLGTELSLATVAKTWEINWTADFSKIDCKANLS